MRTKRAQGRDAAPFEVDWIDTMHAVWQADLTRFLFLCTALVFAAAWLGQTRIETWDWGDVPTWLAAVGTVLAVSVALWESSGERRRRQHVEHRAQALLISAWFDGDIVLLNQSDEPVYEVVTNLVSVQGAGPKRGEDNRLSEYRWVHNVLPPGRWVVSVPHGWGGMSAFPAAEVAFTDGTGAVHWVRRGNGTLTEISESPREHYGLKRPIGYEPLIPIDDRPAKDPA